MAPRSGLLRNMFALERLRVRRDEVGEPYIPGRTGAIFPFGVRRRFPSARKPESEGNSPPETPESLVAERESSEPVSDDSTKSRGRIPRRRGRHHPLANHPYGPVILAQLHAPSSPVQRVRHPGIKMQICILIRRA